MTTADRPDVVTLEADGTVDELLRRAVVRIEAAGLEVIAVVDHNGDAAEAGLSMPETKLVLFGGPAGGTELMVEHPGLALDLPLKLLIRASDDGKVFVSYPAPESLARRHGLTGKDADAFRIVETIALATRSSQ